MNEVKDFTKGWWVPACEWDEQKVYPQTGVWEVVKTKKGKIVKACNLYGRDGWWNGNYEPVRGVVEWFKNDTWFSSREDKIGKVAEYQAYKAEVLSGGLSFRGYKHVS